MNAINTHRQSGAVLLVAMVFLLLIAMLSTTTMSTSTMEVLMAGNEQSRVEALERSQAIVEVLGEDNATYRVQTVGYMRCSASHSHSNCDTVTANDLLITNTDVLGLLSAATVSYSAEFYYEGGVPAVSLGNASGQSYSAAYFDIDVSYDDVNPRGGASEVSQGVGIRVPTSDQGGAAPLGTSSDVEMQLDAT